MNRLRWMLARSAERLGLPALLALVLACALAVYLVLVLWPAQQRLAELERQPQPARARPAMVLPPAPVTFLQGFPAADAFPTQLQALFDTAGAYGLAPGEVSYKWERRRDEPLQRCQVSFVLDAPYPDTRAFLDDALAALPHVAIDALGFSRGSVREETVRASIRLTFYLVRP